ncbi:uncharacterized protein ACMZJ9_019846 [Mantella aurantiaca]
MDLKAYFKRVNMTDSGPPSLSALRELHRHHVLSVPTENLGLHSGEKIIMKTSWIYEKIVVRNRGGICYENNGLFLWVLEELGYQPKVLSARVKNKFTGVYGPNFAHILMMVELEGKRWLCDVGFGEGIIDPILLEDGWEEEQDNGVFRLRVEREIWYLERKDGDLWRSLFMFTLDERKFEDFKDMCEYHQTSPSSIFPCKSLCSLQLPGGRLTYMGHRLITTEFTKGGGYVKTTQDLKEDEIPDLLRDRFGIVLKGKLIPKDEDIIPPYPKTKPYTFHHVVTSSDSIQTPSLNHWVCCMMTQAVSILQKPTFGFCDKVDTQQSNIPQSSVAGPRTLDGMTWLSKMDMKAYFKRVNMTDSGPPSLSALRELHRHHVLSVPAENLGLHSGEKIIMKTSWIYEKIVVRNRGGICYENNGLFLWVLEELGYQPKVLSARVRNKITGVYGPNFDHMITMVELEGKRWLCDVGFGEGIIDPILLEDGWEEEQDNGVFRFRVEREIWYLERKDGDLWRSLFMFTLDERKFEDFKDMCEYHQTSPSSVFTCKSFCSLHLLRGRLTYMGHRLITTEFTRGGGYVKTTQDLTEDEIPDLLRDRFGIILKGKLIPKDEDIIPPVSC